MKIPDCTLNEIYLGGFLQRGEEEHFFAEMFSGLFRIQTIGSSDAGLVRFLSTLVWNTVLVARTTEVLYQREYTNATEAEQGHRALVSIMKIAESQEELLSLIQMAGKNVPGSPISQNRAV